MDIVEKIFDFIKDLILGNGKHSFVSKPKSISWWK